MANTYLLRITDDSTTLIDETETYTPAGNAKVYTRMDVGTSEVTYTLPTSIGNAGCFVVKNLDTTNYMDIGFATTRKDIRVPPNRSIKIFLQPTVASLYLIANTAAVEALLYASEAEA